MKRSNLIADYDYLFSPYQISFKDSLGVEFGVNTNEYRNAIKNGYKDGMKPRAIKAEKFTMHMCYHRSRDLQRIFPANVVSDEGIWRDAEQESHLKENGLPTKKIKNNKDIFNRLVELESAVSRMEVLLMKIYNVYYENRDDSVDYLADISISAELDLVSNNAYETDIGDESIAALSETSLNLNDPST